MAPWPTAVHSILRDEFNLMRTRVQKYRAVTYDGDDPLPHALQNPRPRAKSFESHQIHFSQMSADTVTDSDVELAKNAKSAFDNHRYESCHSSLNKLLDARRTDARVAHNRAVAQYLLSNLTLTDDFRKSLHSVSAQVCASSA